MIIPRKEAPDGGGGAVPAGPARGPLGKKPPTRLFRGPDAFRLMSRAAFRTTFLAALAAAATTVPRAPAAAQEVPADVRPFVSLRGDAIVELYQDPVLRDGEIVRKGTLARRTRQVVPLGSGTVIGEGGLILTNFHVYDFESTAVDREEGRLLTIDRLSDRMRVYELRDNDPFTPPEARFVAEPLCLDEERDLALLRIVGEAGAEGSGGEPGTGPPAGLQVGAVELGSPYELPIQGDLTILGYPAKGGSNLTVTTGRFLNYANDIPFVRDGALVTDAPIAGGNSGGAALFGGRLVGIPTQVSPKAERGSDYGYLHPVSWATRCLAEASVRHGIDVPEPPEEWVVHRYNPDAGSERLFAGGKVMSANSGSPAPGAKVLVHRTDRKLDEIVKLHAEVAGLMLVVHLKGLAGEGASPEEIADRFDGLDVGRVRRILATEVSREALSPDARSALEGEFFFATAEAEEDGFFMLPVPRERKLTLIVAKEGFRPYETVISTGAGLWQDLGERQIYRKPF